MTVIDNPIVRVRNYGDLDITTDQAELLAALKFTAVNISRRLPMQVLCGALLTASPTGLDVSRFDYDVSNTETIRGEGTGRTLVPAAALKAMVEKMDAGPLTLRVVGPVLMVEQGELLYTLPAIDLDDFPALPTEPGQLVATLAGSRPAVEVSGKRVMSVRPGAGLYEMRSALVAACLDETLPMLTAALFDTSNGSLRVVCTDRYRMTVLETGAQAQPMPPLLVPAKALDNIAVQLKAVEQVQVYANVTVRRGETDGYVTFVGDRRRMTVRVIDGEFPKYRSLIPTAHDHAVTISSAALRKALQQVAVAANGNAPVLLTPAGEALVIAAGGPDTGDIGARKTVPCGIEGDPVRWAANPTFLLDGIAALTGKADYPVHVAITTPTRPFILRSELFPALTYLLMPVRTAS